MPVAYTRTICACCGYEGAPFMESHLNPSPLYRGWWTGLDPAEPNSIAWICPACMEQLFSAKKKEKEGE